MMSGRHRTDRQISGDSGRGWVQQGASLFIFLIFAVVAMLTVYWYFSPNESKIETNSGKISDNQFAMVDPNAQLAPIFKEVEAKPVTQRLIQSPPPLIIGIVAGHRGNDSGTECQDGLTEVEITTKLTEQMVSQLNARDIKAEDLDEFDSRLENYSATALISVHVDSCDYINELATGFKIAGSPYTDSSALSICVQQAYADNTNLSYHANSVTPHMANYHAFRTIGRGTPAIIIEVGFLNLDRQILTDGSDVIVSGLIEGIDCYLDQTR